MWNATVKLGLKFETCIASLRHMDSTNCTHEQQLSEQSAGEVALDFYVV